MKLFIRAHVPLDQANSFLQHIRNFDTAHPGSRFEIGVDAPDLTMADAVEMLQVNPGLTFTKLYNKT